MKTFLITISLLGILVSPVFGGFEITARNLSNAFEIPGSRSPDGPYALYCINQGLTTATFIGIMPTTRESVGLETQLFQHGSDKKKYKQFLKVLWTSDSSLVVHMIPVSATASYSFTKYKMDLLPNSMYRI